MSDSGTPFVLTLPEDVSTVLDYFIISSGCTQRSTGGCELWINLGLAYGQLSDTRLKLHNKSLTSLLE